MDSKATQPYIYTYAFSPNPHRPSRHPRNTEQSSVWEPVGPCWVSVLNTAVCEVNVLYARVVSGAVWRYHLIEYVVTCEWHPEPRRPKIQIPESFQAVQGGLSNQRGFVHVSDVAGNPILSRENVRTHGIILMKSLGSGGRLDIFNLGSGHFFFFLTWARYLLSFLICKRKY